MRNKMHRYKILIVVSLIYANTYASYLLFTPFHPSEIEKTTYLFDSNDNIINTWINEEPPASMPYLLQDSSIIYPYMVDAPTMVAGGTGGGLRSLSWDGELQWDYKFADALYQQHHDIEPLMNGNVLILVWERMSADSAYALGRSTINNSLNQMWSTAVLELEPISGDIVWEWHLWDHLVQDVDPNLPNHGMISDHPELFDINCGDVGTNAGGPQTPNADWMHMNSVHYNPVLDQIILSSRLQNEIFIIDHSTTKEEAAGHSGGSYGMGGDFLYRWGNPKNYNRGTEDDQILTSQHSASWIPNGMSGSGNIILFNNFHNSTSSAVIEFSPPMDANGNYIINDNDPFGPESYDWSYEIGLIVPMQGGAFRNESGNTIITKTHLGKIIEVDSLGEIIWEYTHEIDSGTPWIARTNTYKTDYLITAVLGDYNFDGIVNILDVVIAVNIVINGSNNSDADINDDGLVNILDIVILVNIIIEQ